MFTEIIITHDSCTSAKEKKGGDDISKYFSDLFLKTGFDISCKLFVGKDFKGVPIFRVDTVTDVL